MKKYVLKRGGSPAPERLNRYRSELNEEQFRVATAKPGAALVVAGAGTGKTRAITYRVAFLIEQGVSPQRILLATFTNRAAREMLRRVETLTGSDNVHRVYGGTFHRLANLTLRRHAESIGFDASYSILDSEDAKELINVSIDEAGIDTKKKRFPKAEVIQSIVSFASNTDRSVADVIIDKFPYFEPFTRQIELLDLHYHRRKQERNVMDYDDLLLNWKRLLIQKPAICDKYADQFQHILVDEYQDTNKLQAEIIDLLAAKHRNVMVVGDDAQSIFSWRGAEFTNIYEFPTRYPEAEVYKLETNYRSTPEILGLANTSIASNRRQFPKLLTAVRASREMPPALVPCADVEQQSAFVASRILELRDEGVGLEDMTVMYRSHYHSIELQLELTRRGIPYRVRSGMRFFEQAHVKDVIAYMRVIVNPRDELAWKRILKMIPGIGNVTANRIYDDLTLKLGDGSGGTFSTALVATAPRIRDRSIWRNFIVLLEMISQPENRNDPAKQIELVLTHGYETYLQENYENAESRIEDLKGLAAYASRYKSTDEFLSELALISTERFSEPTPVGGEDVIMGGDEDELLTLTSVHQAKGLEWKVVFLIWAAEGKFPSPRSLKEIDSEEEERRLWYVAITRARDELYLTYPLMMTGYDRQTVIQKPSRFITECPPALYEMWDLEEQVAEAPAFIDDGAAGGYLN
jgi:DNA helicase II / ATP-dependent DNA helicase PcrA